MRERGSDYNVCEETHLQCAVTGRGSISALILLPKRRRSQPHRRSSGPSTIVPSSRRVSCHHVQHELRRHRGAGTRGHPIFHRDIASECYARSGHHPKTGRLSPSVEASPATAVRRPRHALTPTQPNRASPRESYHRGRRRRRAVVSEEALLQRLSTLASTADTSENEWRERLTIGKDVSIPSAGSAPRSRSRWPRPGEAARCDAHQPLDRSEYPRLRSRPHAAPLGGRAQPDQLRPSAFSRRADPTLVDKAGHTPLDYARRLGHGGISMLLALGPPLEDDKRVFEGLEGLSLHAALNHPMRLKQLLKHGSPRKNDPNAKDPDGDRTPLHWASARGTSASTSSSTRTPTFMRSIPTAGRRSTSPSRRDRARRTRCS